MSEEQKTSQGRGHALRDQRLLAWMVEDFDGGFGKVVEDYWRELYFWACKLLESSGLTYMAEDAVQDGLFSTYRDLRYHRQKLCNLHLQHWLYAIVRQKTIECREQGNKTPGFAGLLGWENEEEDIVARRLADVTSDPTHRLERWESICEIHGIVTELLKCLTKAQREVVVLKFLSQDGTESGEVSFQQIAERLHKPAGTVRSDMSRAMHHLRKRLVQRHEGGRMIQESDLSVV